MTPFLEKFSRKYHLPIPACEALLGRMERCEYRKGECIVRQGERNGDFYLVSRGVWLGHYLHEGNDISLWFAGEGEAIFSTRSYVDDRPSSITIEAMCDAELYALPRRELELFFGESVEAANFGRRLFEVQFLDLENWLLAAGGAPRAEERYRALMEENPELLRVVPLKHIASYLWITPQSLSRIRARLHRRKP